MPTGPRSPDPHGAPTTPTAAVDVTTPSLAEMLASVPVAGAVCSPPAVIVPPPEATDHLIFGCVASVNPNWSSAVALNCREPPALSPAWEGENANLASVGTTTTTTAGLTTESPPTSV